MGEDFKKALGVDEIDRLRMAFSAEKAGRLQAERANLQMALQQTEREIVLLRAAQQGLTRDLQAKYGLGEHDQINFESGAISRQPTDAKPSLAAKLSAVKE